MKKINRDCVFLPEGDDVSGIITLSVDIAQSEIEWNGYKAAGHHHGTLKIKSGTIEIDPVDKRPVGGTIYFDMLSINDIDQTGMLKDTLENHLKSADFFDVAKFPEAKIEVIKTDHTPGTSGAYGITAALTIKGIRNEISFQATYSILPQGGIRIETGVVIVDRTKWGITFGSKNIFKKLEDHIVADNFDVKAILLAH